MEKGSKIQASTIGKIPEGKLEELKQIAIEYIKMVKEKEPGTLRYDCFISSDETEYEVRSEFKNVEALIEHAININKLRGLRGDFSIDHAKLFGDLPPQYLEMLKSPNIAPTKLFSLWDLIKFDKPNLVHE